MESSVRLNFFPGKFRSSKKIYVCLLANNKGVSRSNLVSRASYRHITAFPISKRQEALGTRLVPEDNVFALQIPEKFISWKI